MFQGIRIFQREVRFFRRGSAASVLGWLPNGLDPWRRFLERKTSAVKIRGGWRDHKVANLKWSIFLNVRQIEEPGTGKNLRPIEGRCLSSHA